MPIGPKGERPPSRHERRAVQAKTLCNGHARSTRRTFLEIAIDGTLFSVPRSLRPVERREVAQPRSTAAIRALRTLRR
jgi:hypothetical protein